MDFPLMIIRRQLHCRCRILRELDLLTDSHCLSCTVSTHIRNCVYSIRWYLPTYNAHCAIYVILCTQLLLLGISTATLPHSCRPDECRGLINVRVLRSIYSSIHNNILSLVVVVVVWIVSISFGQADQPTHRPTD